MKIAKIIRPVIGLAVVGTIAYFGVNYYLERQAEAPDPNEVWSSGVVEAVEVRVGTKIAGPIEELLVEEGDEVVRDQLIAKIETTDYELQLEGAEAALGQSRALYQDTLKGLRQEEITQLEEVMRAKEAAYERVRIDYERKQELAAQKVLAVHEADLARKQMETAYNEWQSAQQQVRIARMGKRQDQIEAARQQVQQAEATIAELRKKIADGEIRAPLDGRVSIKNMEAGEIATIGATIVTVIDLERPWVRVFVPEDKLGRVKLGMEAEIISDSFPDKTYRGIIRYISPEAEFTPKNVQTKEERVKLVYALKIYIDNPEQELKPGMPVDAVIRLDQEADGGNDRH
jgi:HlyD family secretion protein